MNGYAGRVLVVDLTTGAHEARPLSAEIAAACIGGAGLAVRLLLDYCAAGVDPLGPDNPLILATNPFAATSITTSAKYAVATRSPLTGMIADSLSSSQLAIDLKRTGYDAIVLTGQCPGWSVLAIDGDCVTLDGAHDLVGLDTEATEQAFGQRWPGRAVVIGPAGEHRVRYAALANGGRFAGRGGAGAVMGSKRLKGIVLRGDRPPAVADPVGLRQVSARLVERSTGPATAKYRHLGTPANLLAFDRVGILPSYNFQQSTFAGADQLSGEQLYRLHRVASAACAGCMVGCEHLYRRLDESAEKASRLEYETLFALGPMLGLDRPDAVIALARRCDALGLDTISLGGTLAWAFEAADRGLLRPADDEPALRFGDEAAVAAWIDAIAYRRGLGDLLAEGSRRAAQWLGGGSNAWAMHVKGMEMPGYDPRGLKTLALGLATAPRGACHNRSSAYESDMSGAVDRFAVDRARGALAMDAEDRAAALDSLSVCKFIRGCFDDFYGEAAELYRLVTGIPMDQARLRQAGARISTMKKLFNLRQGWVRADDTLPPRLLNEPLSDGPGAGERLTASELDLMLDAYYAARGWDTLGRPTPATLHDLGLTALAGGH